MVWHSSQGPIRVTNMTDSHLVNTINLLQRRAFQARSNAIIGAVLNISPIDVLEAEDMMETDIESFAPRIYFDMVREANSRKLQFSRELVAPVPPYMMLWDTEEEDSWQ